MSDEKRYVTVEELCGEVPERDHADTYLEQYDAWIRHRTRAPLDLVLKLQGRYMSGKRKRTREFFAEMLRYLILKPRIESDQQLQALMKGDAKVLIDIVGQAIGDVGDLREEVEEEAGE